jgi:hypothetical protein
MPKLLRVAETELEVDLSLISDAEFQFFENHYLIFRHERPGG